MREARGVRFAMAVVVLCSAVWAQNKPQSQAAAIDARVQELLSKMTLEEKIGQLNQFNVERDGLEGVIAAGQAGSILNATGAERSNRLQHIAVEKSRLHIPILIGFDVIHGYRTIFPIPLGIASTWDPQLAEQEAQVAAREARAAGVRWTFAPMLDIARDPRWGRISEGAGEDPFLGAAMAAAYVRGFQGSNLAAADRIAACAKHYVAYGAAEGGRDYNSAEVSERTLREIYLPPFQAAAEAGAATFMSAFNTLNGIPGVVNHFTLGQVLRNEWHFRGFVVSDWNAVAELIPHGVAADLPAAVRKSLDAGVDMDMVSESYLKNMAGLVRSGAIPQAEVEEAVRRVLRVKFQLGLFDDPYTDPTREAATLLSPPHLESARKVAQKSLVLLKNDGNLLPLAKNVGTLAVIGPLADSKLDMLGNWFGNGKADDAVTVLQGFRAKVGASTRLLYEKGVEVEGAAPGGIERAVAAARQADVALLVLGERGNMSGEAKSRAFLELPGEQERMLEAVAATGKPVVLVVMSGRPLAISWAAQHVPAILEAWFPGTQGGNAVADVLFGDVNPSGKLPVTFPRTVGQVPIYYNHLNTGRPFFITGDHTGYLDLPSTPLFPFGFGLSYTRFSYSNLQLSGKQLSGNESLKISVEVKNTGDRAGEEVVQLYVRDLVASVSRPVKELKGFQRVALGPGESQRVEFTLSRGQLSFWNAEMRYGVEPGPFKVFVGPNSAEGLEGGFEVK